MQTSVFGAAPRPSEAPERLHGLDALRAAALLAGIFLHSTLSFTESQGFYTPVGVSQPQPFLSWLIYSYIHTFRLPIFFLLAGFFGALVVERKGEGAYLRDRLVRIFLVFVAFLFPMKVAIGFVWVWGATKTNTVQYVLPGLDIVHESPFRAMFRQREVFPNVTLTHLWFLYVLSYLVVVFMAARMAARAAMPAVTRTFARQFGSVMRHRAAPYLLGLALTVPIFHMSAGFETPSTSFSIRYTISAMYLLFFAVGWGLYGKLDVLTSFRRHWASLVGTGLVTSLVAFGIAHTWPTAWQTVGGRMAISVAEGLTTVTSAFGYMGAFLEWWEQPSPRARYVADASYWMYITHFPIVMGLQVLLYGSGMPWWLEVPLVNLVTLPLLLGTYHVLVRNTWLGRWLNGKRSTPTALSPEPQLVAAATAWSDAPSASESRRV